MDVQAAEARRGQDRPGQDQSIGRDHRDIGIMGGEPRLFLLTAQRHGSEDGDAQRLGRLLHRRGDQLPPAPPAGAGRLAIAGDDVMPGLRQDFQDRDGKARRAHEDDPHGNASLRWRDGAQPPICSPWHPPRSRR
ncbi:hypothetical protein QE360_002680 [Sphingomonas sp. SORGH_AS789]|nr:hypothetical protein [Sphingomonas sp. SORGH_AS_0789]